MRKPHPLAILSLVALFAGQTMLVLAAPCKELETAPRHVCCCEMDHDPDDCGCYATPPEEPPAREPVAQVQHAPVVAALISTPIPAPNPTPRRLTSVEKLRLPAPPVQRVPDTRAPPCPW